MLKPFKIDLQLFAEGNTNTAGAGEEKKEDGQQGNANTAGAGETADKKFTQADIDRILTERLAKEKKKFETQLSEEKRLAQLTAEEQERERFKKEKEEFENEKKSISKEKMIIEISKQLTAEGLPVNFANRLYSENADDVKTAIAEFKSEWTKALNNAVEQRIKGKTPEGGQSMTTEEEAIKAKIRAAAGLK